MDGKPIRVMRGLISEDAWLFILLCAVLFLSVLTTGHNVFKNAWLIFDYEAVFVTGFLVYRLRNGIDGPLFPARSVGFWLLTAWFVSVTLSLLNSPYGLMTEWFAVQRYFQTLFHVVFFLCVRIFLSIYPRSTSPLLLVIPISVAILALIYIGIWNVMDLSPDMGRRFWYIHPPLNMHIRIIDFLATAASSMMIPFFLKRPEVDGQKPWMLVSVVTLASIVWGFLFWCGGRGGIISAIVASVLVLGVMRFKRCAMTRPLICFVFVVLVGVILANLFAVFPWNGIDGAAERTMASADSLERLSNSRFDYWMSVWESLKDTGSYVLGLGSQGYCYMPNRVYAFQPHNLVFQFLAEWGFVGCGLFLVILLYGVIRGVNEHLVPRERAVSLPALAAFAIIFSLVFHSLVDGIFYHAQSTLYMAIAYGVWLAKSSEEGGARELQA